MDDAATIPTPKPVARCRPLAALGRVLRAPALIALLWVLQLALAKLAAMAPRAAATAAMGDWRWFDDGHRMRALVELFADNPAVIAAVVGSLMSTTIIAAVFSVVTAPAIIARLDARRRFTELCGSCARYLGPMLAQSGYGLIFRALCTGLAVLPATLIGPGALPLFFLFAAFPVLVLDRARTAVVLEEARAYHPMTFLRAIVDVARRPLWWLSGALIDTAKNAVGIAALLFIVSHDLGAAGIWIARLAGLLALMLGMWRVSLARL